MRFLLVFSIGAVLGFLTAYLVRVSEKAPPAPIRTFESPASKRLESDLERARAEIAALRIEIEALRGQSPKASPTSDAAPPEEAVVEGEPTLAEREARAREVLALLDKEVSLRESYQRHSHNEQAFPNWSAAQFLDDPAFSALAGSLSEDRREEVELRFARAYQRIKSLDLRRQLATAEAIAVVVEAHLEGRELALTEEGATEEDLSVSLPGGLQVTLPSAVFPEINVHRLERDAAMVEWILELERCLSGGR